MLRLLELREGHDELRVEVLVAEELDRALVDGARTGDAATFLLEARVLYPVLHLRMHLYDCKSTKNGIRSAQTTSAPKTKRIHVTQRYAQRS